MISFSIKIDERIYAVDAAAPVSLAIPLDFGGPQPNAYGVAKATAAACESGALVGDTRRGGSCNFEEYRLIAHCNGTHTEGVGHITHERISVHDCLQESLIPAVFDFGRAGKRARDERHLRRPFE
jgi:arylformamidase